MELDIIFKVFVGSVGVTFLSWLIVHFNGKTLLGVYDLVIAFTTNKSKLGNAPQNWLSVASEAEVILLGRL